MSKGSGAVGSRAGKASARSGGAGGVSTSNYEAQAERVAEYLTRPENKTAYESVYDYTRSGYARMNKMLIMGFSAYAKQMGLEAAQRELEKAQVLQKALVDARKRGLNYTGEVHRGMALPQKLINKWTSSKIVVNNNFFSTSVDSSRAFDGNVVLHIRTKTGIPIEKVSHFKHEKEVLIPSGRRLRVLSHRVDSDGITHISMKEL